MRRRIARGYSACWAQRCQSTRLPDVQTPRRSTRCLIIAEFMCLASKAPSALSVRALWHYGIRHCHAAGRQVCGVSGAIPGGNSFTLSLRGCVYILYMYIYLDRYMDRHTKTNICTHARKVSERGRENDSIYVRIYLHTLIVSFLHI